MLYTEADLEASMDRIDVLNFHEEKEINGIRFWAYHAGHVLGAAMFMIEIAGVKVLYTGDFSRQEDRHLMAAEIPTSRPDVMIVVSQSQSFVSTTSPFADIVSLMGYSCSNIYSIAILCLSSLVYSTVVSVLFCMTITGIHIWNPYP
jgi:hypothetical protein